MIQSVNLPPSAYTITSSAHCSTLQPSAAYSQTSSAHPVHTLQQPLHLQCTLQPCTAMYSYLQPIFSAHCSTLQPSAAYSQTSSAHPVHTAAAITSLMHTLQQPLHLQCTLQPCTAMYSYLQPIFSTPCSQLQPSTTTYTTAIPFSAHCSYTI